jgi:hypothetical protein
MRYKLLRHDGLVKEGDDILFIEYDEDGTYKAFYKEVRVNTSLLMFPFNPSYKWLTTSITEILEQQEDYVKFTTKNSTYELWTR